jgi:hypothetical protein
MFPRPAPGFGPLSGGAGQGCDLARLMARDRAGAGSEMLAKRLTKISISFYFKSLTGFSRVKMA